MVDFNKTNDILDFGVPEEKHSIIKVIGVGGGGGNAVNHMYKEGIHDVTFVVCNTDNQALNDSPVPVKLQIGAEGLGAGNKPEVEIIDYRAKNGLLFEKLIVSFLKDKSKFKLLSWTGDKYCNGIYDLNNLNPDLHIQQIINGQTIDYFVECKWHHYWQRSEKGYFYEIVPGQLRRYRKFASKNKRVVLIAYAYGRTGDNPRGIYLVPLRAFRENKIHKVVADKKYRIGQNAESFAQYMENYFAVLFAKKKK